MQKVQNVNVNNAQNQGYYVSKEQQRENYYQTESHLYKQTPLRGIKAGLHKLTNDVFTYFPKGLAGSKNSDFYEYLSMGMVPYIAGSATLIALSKVANKLFNLKDGSYANKASNAMAAGVLLYGFGKWATKKFSRTLIHASTGVDLDMKYIKKVVELPEDGEEQGLIRTQYPNVFDSINLYRNDLLTRDSLLNHNDIYYYDDKIAKKAGFKDKLSAPSNVVSDKIRELKARSGAMENVGQYVVAATGVALGAQEAFREIKFFKGFNMASFKGNVSAIFTALKDAPVQLWQGTNRNIITKNAGKALIIGSALVTLLDWLIPTIKFKHNPNTMKSKIDRNKDCEVG